jgi:hypothetical protein
MSTQVTEPELAGIDPAEPAPRGPRPAPEPAPSTGGGGRTRRNRARRRRIRRIVYLALVILLAPAVYSYVRALRYPGSASNAVRTMEWLRDHGGGGLVDNVEVWYYTRHHPPTSGRPSAPLPPAPTPPGRLAVASAERSGHLDRLHPAVRPVMRGEATWRPGPTLTGTGPGIFTAWFRPDPNHPTLVAGVMSIDPGAARLDLVAGTREPGGGPWPGDAEVVPAVRSRTLAAFNSGFLLRDSHGGFFIDGHTAGRLLPGRATMVIRGDGTADVGTWGREVRMSRDVRAVRQNLDLIVDRGAPAPGLVHNWQNRWGSRKSQLEYVWRSGVGVDHQGHILYVAGNHFTLQTLADALAQAGAVRAMQLDIHSQMVSANLFDTGRQGLIATKLLPTMPRPATRYLRPDQRDFFTVTVR